MLKPLEAKCVTTFQVIQLDFPGGSDSKASVYQCGKTWVQSLGREDSLEKEMATHSSTLA